MYSYISCVSCQVFGGKSNLLFNKNKLDKNDVEIVQIWNEIFSEILVLTFV